MDDDLRRLDAEVEKWFDYEARLREEGKAGAAEHSAVLSRLFSASAARVECAKAKAVPSGSPSPEPARNQRGNHRTRKPKRRIELCDVRHIWPHEGVGPCVRCGAPQPRAPRPRMAKAKTDPAVAMYREERKRRPAVIPGPSRHPLVWVTEGKRMQAVREAE